MKQNVDPFQSKQGVGDRASMAEAHAPMRNLASFSKLASAGAGKAPSLAEKIKAHMEQEAREEASTAASTSVPVRAVSLAKLSRQLTAQSALSAKVRAKRESQANRGSAAAKAAEKLETAADLHHETHLDEHLGHTRCIYCLAFSPNGHLLLTGSADREVKLWNVQTCQALHTFYGNEQWVTSVAFSNHAPVRVATGGDDHYIRIWSHAENSPNIAEGWELTHEFGLKHDQMHMHRGGVQSVQFAPDDESLVSASTDTMIKSWRIGDKELDKDLSGHEDWVSRAVFSPDGMTVASSSYDNTARLWRYSDGEEILVLRGHANFVSCVAYAPDGRTVATSSGDYSVKIWEIRRSDGSMADGLEPLRTLYGHRNWVLSCHFDGDSRRLCSSSADRTVIVWQLSGSYPKKHTMMMGDWVEDAQFAPKESSADFVAGAGHEGHVTVWDVSGESAVVAHVLEAHASWTSILLRRIFKVLWRIINGLPLPLSINDTALLSGVFESAELKSESENDDDVAIIDFLEDGLADKYCARLLRRTVFYDAHGPARKPRSERRSVEEALRHRVNVGELNITWDGIMHCYGETPAGSRSRFFDSMVKAADSAASAGMAVGRRGTRRASDATSRLGKMAAGEMSTMTTRLGEMNERHNSMGRLRRRSCSRSSLDSQSLGNLDEGSDSLSVEGSQSQASSRRGSLSEETSVASRSTSRRGRLSSIVGSESSRGSRSRFFRRRLSSSPRDSSLESAASQSAGSEGSVGASGRCSDGSDGACSEGQRSAAEALAEVESLEAAEAMAAAEAAEKVEIATQDEAGAADAETAEAVAAGEAAEKVELATQEAADAEAAEAVAAEEQAEKVAEKTADPAAEREGGGGEGEGGEAEAEADGEEAGPLPATREPEPPSLRSRRQTTEEEFGT